MQKVIRVFILISKLGTPKPDMIPNQTITYNGLLFKKFEQEFLWMVTITFSIIVSQAHTHTYDLLRNS